MNSAHAAKVALFKSALEKVDPASYHAACMSVFHRFYDTCSIAQILNMMNVAIESLLPHSGVPILLLRFGTALYMRNNFPVLNMGYYFGFGKEVAEAVRDTGFGQGMQMFGCHFQMTEVLMAVEGRFVLYYGSSNSSRLFAFVASLVDQWVLKTLLLQHKVNNYSAIASAFRSNLEIHSQTIFDEQFRKANLILVKNPPADNDLSAASTAATHLPPDSYTGSSGQQHPPKRVRFEAATVDQPPRRSPPPSSDPAVNVYPRSSTTPPRTSPPPSSEPTVDQPPPPPPLRAPVAQSLPVHQPPSALTVDRSLPNDAIDFSQVDRITYGSSITFPGDRAVYKAMGYTVVNNTAVVLGGWKGRIEFSPGIAQVTQTFTAREDWVVSKRNSTKFSLKKTRGQKILVYGWTKMDSRRSPYWEWKKTKPEEEPEEAADEDAEEDAEEEADA